MGFLTELFAELPTPLQLFSPDGRSVAVNRAFLDLFGVAPPPAYCVLTDDIARRTGRLADIHRAFAGESVVLSTVWYDPGELPGLGIVGGRRVAIETRTLPVRGAGGRLTHVLFAFRDVTARERLVERQLEQERAERFALVGNWHIDLGGTESVDANPLSWSEGVFRIFGIEPFSAVPSNELFFSFVHPDDRDRIRQAVALALAERRPYAIEHRIVRPDGAVRVVFEHADVLCDATGEPSRLEGIVVDVTERRSAEATAVRFRDVVESTTDFVGMADPSGRITYVNAAGRAMAGCAAVEEILGHDVGEFYSPREARRILEEAIPVALRHGVWSGETSLRRSDGSEIPVSQVILAHRDRDGAVEYFSTVVRDLTEMRRSEEHQRQSQRMEAIGELTGGIAHDFNNLLTIILGWSEQLIARAADERCVTAASAVMEAAERGASLTRKLLAFSRRQVLDARPLRLDSLVSGFSRLLPRLLGETIEVAFEPPPELGAVVADPSQIEQVLLNLAVNARDAMPRGGRLTFALADFEASPETPGPLPELDSGRWVVLSVSDTGTGMSPEVRARIFEPFYTTKEPGKGTGLGLATVYGIVRQSGGQIEVESEPGRGATFRIFLPRFEGSALEAAPQPAAGGTAGIGERILLVEDEAEVRSLVAEQLASLGYRVTACADGHEALARLGAGAEPPDLALTDVVMPGLGGRDLAAALRERSPGLRVLFMSGYTRDALSRSGVEEGGVPLLRKPFTLATLARQVRAALDAPRG
ncbi:MAG: PAS domain S-box protein [Thermoanaerobaculia bacterium]|nr:MAG: PAS domain S-box protein [Thermoanaerobaculia bacterium]MBZ0101475.1 PAS domain S-box protein [Thermoanaerobaculia bacterium]